MVWKHKSQSRAWRTGVGEEKRKQVVVLEVPCRGIHDDSPVSLPFVCFSERRLVFVCSVTSSRCLRLTAASQSLETCGQIKPTHAVYIYPALTNHTHM